MQERNCKITNGCLTWILEVDEHNILFNLIDNAQYFYEHYKGLGYKMVIEDKAHWIKCLEEERA